ncbi:class I SAM-dependent methyltransferase, partial [Frankia sp. EI5c]|uniref:class I SAM-dependent methyltransferase n=1 Tax=Frankia sp. EI5c TaxID=683316 RepID=UPI001F5B4E00
MDELTIDGLTVDGIAVQAISMGGFTIEGITVERILPPRQPGQGGEPRRDADPIRIPVRNPGAEPVSRPARLGGPRLADFTFAELEPAGLNRLGLDLRRLELLAGFPSAGEWSFGLAPSAAPGAGGAPGAAGNMIDATDLIDSADLAGLTDATGFPGLVVEVERIAADRATLENGTADRGTVGMGAAERGTAMQNEAGGSPDTAPAVPAGAHPTVAVFERAARDYDADIHGVPFFRPLGRTLVSAAGIRPGDDVVDLACGRGAVLFPAAAATGPTGTVRAFDLAPTMVELTATDAEARSLPWVDVTVADAMRPPVEPHSADVVLCGMGLFLLPDPAAALARWRGLLRPGGRLAVSVFGAPDPLWDRPDYPLRRATGLGAADRRPGLAILQEGALAEALAAAGLTLTRDESVATDLVFRDVEHWWQWAWGTAVRSMLEQIDSSDLPAMIDDLT